MPTPTTVEELKTARAAAGERYAAAIAELQASLIELAAYDVALTNRNISDDPTGYRTFHGMADFVPHSLQHPQFGTYDDADWHGQVRSLADQVIRNVAG